MKDRYIILSEKSWHKELFYNLSEYYFGEEWILLETKNEFNIDALKKINPRKIFIPHWSYIIPNEIFNQYECIVFHMTDLPFGRGGSPLQNLILRGLTTTMISAIKVEKGIDTGDVYLKKQLELSGTAKEIFIRASHVIELMIKEIIDHEVQPTPQMGEVVLFARRKESESNIINIQSMEKLFDHIRMLDCDGYPLSYFETEYFRFEFSNAEHDITKNTILANVRIIKK